VLCSRPKKGTPTKKEKGVDKRGGWVAFKLVGIHLSKTKD
jgi:hypothetical protein